MAGAVKLSLCLAVFLSASSAFAARHELRDLYIGARGQAMGGTYVGLADDEQAVYMNPAGMAGIDRQRIHYGIADIYASDELLLSPTSLGSISGTNSVNALIGKNIGARAQISPTFVMPNFGVAILIDQQIAVQAKNHAYPTVTLGYQTTTGVQAAYGITISQKNRRRKTVGGELRLGVGGKILWRRGHYREYTAVELLSMNMTMDGLNAMAGNFGMGFGIDVGAQYVLPLNQQLTLSVGSAVTEIGGVKFASDSDSQPSNFSAGLGLKYKLPKVNLALAYDYRNILQDVDPSKRSHLGLEVELPFISLYGGLNGPYPSYGASFDAWLFRLTALTYTEELAAQAGVDAERRYMLRLALKFGL